MYENTLWTPVRALLSRLTAPRAGAADQSGVFTFDGDLGVGAFRVADAPNDGWNLRSAARQCPPRASDDISSSYHIHTAGSASLSFDTSWTRTAAIAGQGVLWILTVLLLLRWRTSTPWRRPRRRPAAAATPVDGNGDGALTHVSAELETSGATSA